MLLYIVITVSSRGTWDISIDFRDFSLVAHYPTNKLQIELTMNGRLIESITLN